VESILAGRRIPYMEVAQYNYTCGYRRENLATIIAICDWESARYEEARLIYDDGTSDDGVMQINEKVWRGERTIDQWHELVWDAEQNFEIGRDIWENRKSRLGSAARGFEAWVAYSNGNYKKTLQIARHHAAQVDSTFYSAKAFRWWGIRWIPGDGKIFEATWFSFLGETPRAKVRLERWKERYPRLAARLWVPTDNIQPTARDIQIPPDSLDVKVLAMNEGNNFNVTLNDARKELENV
jgi:hypothetical protein